MFLLNLTKSLKRLPTCGSYISNPLDNGCVGLQTAKYSTVIPTQIPSLNKSFICMYLRSALISFDLFFFSLTTVAEHLLSRMDQPKSSQNLIDRKDDVDEVKTIITPLSKYNFYKDMMWINQSENPG
ncbi:9631_t:CDS:1 [Funneliformis geosporum]|uniref:9631_t:CDS:1 n=1 Tax=Funneliformis geosporum TaxID=1117311 RepID=A0A9W4SHD9_9GLOM|nr:9631_t:CDS:1 [Funneliformis geosporum]